MKWPLFSVTIVAIGEPMANSFICMIFNKNQCQNTGAKGWKYRIICNFANPPVHPTYGEDTLNAFWRHER